MSEPQGSRDERLQLLGRRGWSIVGICAAAAIVAVVLGALSGLVIPLVVATVMGVLLAPAVDRLERARIPRSIGAALILTGLAVVVIASVWITVVGVLDNGDEISARIRGGLEYLDDEISDRWDPVGDPESTEGGLADAIPQLFTGVGSWFGTLFSGIAAFVVGTGVSLFFLYYVLRDWRELTAWVGSHLGVEPELGDTFVDDAGTAIRSYFGALTISSVVTAVVIGVAAAVIDVPLAFTIGLVTFVTSYIPYIGAIFSGAFAVLIALGSAGLTEAIIMLAVVIVAQSIVQTLMLTKLSSDSLSLHPIVNLGSTIVGGSVAGFLGAMLSAPIVAIVILVQRRLRENR